MPRIKKEISRKDEITTQFFQLVDQHIHDLLHNKAERIFSTKKLASFLFIHPRHLTNTIKETTGKSPCDIMEERITKEAKQVLLDTNLAIGDVAAKFGYYNPTNFIKFFKGMTGETPLQYRKKHLTLQPA